MPLQDALDRFQRGLERRAANGDVTSADIVDLAGDASLSLAQATIVLDRLVERGWERVLVDARGRVLHPNEVAERVHCWSLGALDLRVVWRLRRKTAVLIA